MRRSISVESGLFQIKHSGKLQGRRIITHYIEGCAWISAQQGVQLSSGKVPVLLQHDEMFGEASEDNLSQNYFTKSICRNTRL